MTDGSKKDPFKVKRVLLILYREVKCTILAGITRLTIRRREIMEQLNNYIIELRVIQDIKYFLEYVGKNASSFCSYYGITSPRNEVEAQFLASIALAKEKAKLLKPDSAVAVITRAGVTLICDEEEEIFFKDFYRPSLKTSYKVFKSFKELLAEPSENISYKSY